MCRNKRGCVGVPSYPMTDEYVSIPSTRTQHFEDGIFYFKPTAAAMSHGR